MKPLAFSVDASPHAAGILLTHGDRALFLKRADNATDHAGEWCCPGGSIEAGETPDIAARREMQEETGLTGLVTGDLNQIDDGDGFVTFRQTVDAETDPTLNEEHTEFQWALLNDPPQPLHPGVAATLKKILGASALDKREYDANNWFEVLDNPLSKVGVYQYSEGSIKKGGDRSKMVGVYRPAEELGSQECINSFRLMPWTDDHPADLFGDKAQGFASTEDKGVRGVIGEQVYFKDGTLYGNLKVFSEDLARKIAGGKRELSCGYHCDFIQEDGVYEGQPYQYVQRNMRGNHVASVSAGRMGSEVRVLDAAEKFTFALDLKDDPTEHATTVAGESVAEKDTSGHSTEKVSDMKTEEEMKKEAADRKAARDAKRSARDSMRAAKDSMSSEEEEGMDAAECAEDAEEEKDDETEYSKDAKDRMRARDKRASARDARKGARDAKAKDADKDDDKKDKGMDKLEVKVDATEIAAIVRREIAAVGGGKSMDANELVKLAVAQVGPAIRKEEAAKASLYGRVSPIIGAFDHAEMTHTDMATYALDKMGAPKASDPVSALDFYLAGRAQVIEAPRARFAQDAAGDDFVSKYLNS